MERAKKARRRGSRKYATPREETYVFRLFVAGDESHSLQARRNLARLCEEHIKGRYTIDIVDVLKDPSTAYENNVLVMTRPSFCTTASERVYITASGCETEFGVT
jgi:hypothetical protein